MPERLQAQPPPSLADTGYCSADRLTAREQPGIESSIAVKRDQYRPHRSGRFGEPHELPDNPTPVARMTRRLQRGDGCAAHALRQQRVEPVFGIVKSVRAFRPFLARGLETSKTSGRRSA